MKSKCYILDNGTNEGKLSLFVQGRSDDSVRVPVFGVLIRHPLANIIVDTGIQNSKCREGIFHDHQADETQQFIPQLAELGLTPDDIDYVINSHLHWDHCGNNYLFKNARVIIRPEEWDQAVAGASRGELYWRFADFDHPNNAGRKAFLPRGGEDIHFLEGIDILFTPGHTAGSQSVLVDTEEGPVLIAEDCIYIRQDNFVEGKLPGICYDDEMQRNSVKKMKALGDDIIVIPGHDPFEKLKKIYG